MTVSFPVFDLAAFEQADAERRRALGRGVDDICRNTGFLAIANHGVPQRVIDDVRDGYVSRASAVRDYGIDPVRLDAELAAT